MPVSSNTLREHPDVEGGVVLDGLEPRCDGRVEDRQQSTLTRLDRDA
jgi:hypothetical protein